MIPASGPSRRWRVAIAWALAGFALATFAPTSRAGIEMRHEGQPLVPTTSGRPDPGVTHITAYLSLRGNDTSTRHLQNLDFAGGDSDLVQSAK